MANAFHIGQRISYDGLLCNIRYIGQVSGTQGEWLGVEWQDTARGKHDGHHNGRRYFECLSKSPTAASFVRPTRAFDTPCEFVDAMKLKYAPEEYAGTGLYQVSGFRDEEATIRISGKVVQEIGFDKISRQLADLKQLRIVLVDSSRIHRPSARFRDLVDHDRGSDIKQTCPGVTELDVSRNLFEDWSEVLDIVRQLPRLVNLRVEGNRFQSLKPGLSEEVLQSAPFANIVNLGLDDTLLAWRDIAEVCKAFPKLTSLSANGNEYEELVEVLLPTNLSHLSLERNGFTSLGDVRALTNLPCLSRLNLKANKISSIDNRPENQKDLVFFTSVTDIDLAFNDILSWPFIDELAKVFPGLMALRISNNPIYRYLKNADGKELAPEDGYMLTLARLGNLARLNFSATNPKERLNAELFYLSQINRLLALAGPDHRDAVLADHARYAELCRIYDQPVSTPQPQKLSSVDSRSLAAALIKVTFKLSSEISAKVSAAPAWTVRIPRSFSIYAVQGMVGRRYNLRPMQLQLVWETEDEEVIRKAADEESEDEDGFSAPASTKMREDVLAPQTRGLGTFVDNCEAILRVQWNQVAIGRTMKTMTSVIQSEESLQTLP